MEEVENVAGIIKVYKDGTIFRVEDNSSLLEGEAPETEVAIKDNVLNEKLGLWVRLYLPSSHLQHQTQTRRLPVILYFHGGGFCLVSPSLPEYHNFSLKLATSVDAIIVSVAYRLAMVVYVAYRLAPEHRLPAAYDDCITALQWVTSHAGGGGDFEYDPWLESHADFSAVCLMGYSAGANIAHHIVALRGGVEAWNPMTLRGSILVQPFFGAEQRTQSESECPRDAVLSLELNDDFWRLSLPVGSDRDHPFSNPWSPGAPKLEEVPLPPLLVAISGRDMLRYQDHEYCELLKQRRKRVEVLVLEEEEHKFNVLQPQSQSCERLIQQISRFISPIH